MNKKDKKLLKKMFDKVIDKKLFNIHVRLDYIKSELEDIKEGMIYSIDAKEPEEPEQPNSVETSGNRPWADFLPYG